MFSSIILLVFFAIRSLALVAPPSPFSQAPPNVAGDLSISNPNITAPAPRRKLYCTQIYGANLPVESCENALAKIPRNPKPHIYEPRFDVYHRGSIPLPLRYLGDDGICAIDVLVHAGVSGDIASSNDIYQQAKALIIKCVAPSGLAGVAQDFTAENELRVIIKHYQPTVECEPRSQTVPSYDTCAAALELMGAGPSKKWFIAEGQRRPGEYAGGTVLPRITTHPAVVGPYPCNIVVNKDSTTPPEKACWFDLWAAAVAVNTMCVQHGMNGTAVSLGDNERITVSVGGALP